MNILAIIFAIASSAQIVAGLPQIREIIRKRSSEELSLVTWIAWLVMQSLCFTYVASVGDPVLMSMSGLWILYYAAMVGVISYYRRFGQPLLARETVAESGQSQP